MTLATNYFCDCDECKVLNAAADEGRRKEAFVLRKFRAEVEAEAAQGYDLFTSPVVNWEKDVADNPKDTVRIRKFESGASRDTDLGKLDFEGFLSPLVLLEFGRYMHLHRIQSDNTLRESDNWQKGIPKTEYMKSLLRHVMDVWLFHREHIGRETMKQALCGVLFNTMGYLHTILIEEDK